VSNNVLGAPKFFALPLTEQPCTKSREDAKEENENDEGCDCDGGKQADGNGGWRSGSGLPIHRSHYLQIIVEAATDGDDGEYDEQKLLRFEGYFKNEEFT
jgi:hypothetical protein